MKYINILLLILLFSSCTKNDGDIGDLFGKWIVTKYESTLNDGDMTNMFFSFQSSVISVIERDKEMLSATEYYGAYVFEKDSITLFFEEEIVTINNLLDLKKQNKFKVDCLSKKKLRLIDEYSIIEFKAY